MATILYPTPRLTNVENVMGFYIMETYVKQSALVIDKHWEQVTALYDRQEVLQHGDMRNKLKVVCCKKKFSTLYFIWKINNLKSLNIHILFPDLLKYLQGLLFSLDKPTY